MALNLPQLSKKDATLSEAQPTHFCLVEVNGKGEIDDHEILSQIDYNSTGSRSLGSTLTFLLKGKSPAHTKRHYHLYFDPSDPAMPISSQKPMVEVTDGHLYQGQESLRINSPSAVYFFHKVGGGFASIVDPDGVDW